MGSNSPPHSTRTYPNHYHDLMDASHLENLLRPSVRHSQLTLQRVCLLLIVPLPATTSIALLMQLPQGLSCTTITHNCTKSIGLRSCYHNGRRSAPWTIVAAPSGRQTTAGPITYPAGRVEEIVDYRWSVAQERER